MGALKEKKRTETQIFIDEDMADVKVVSLSGGVAAVYSARCPGKHSVNEDAAALISFDDSSAVLAVADGMGGARGGEKAAQLAVKNLKKSLHDAAVNNESLRSGILDGIEKAHEAIRELGIGAGTTLAVVEIMERQVRSYNIGDSMIMALGRQGKVKLQPSFHSPVGYGLRGGFLDEEEAMHHDERHIVSNAVGTSNMHIELGSMLLLSEHDTVLVASDGLVDNMHVDEIVEYVRKGSVEEALHELVKKCRSRMEQPHSGEPSKADDLTCILFRLG